MKDRRTPDVISGIKVTAYIHTQYVESCKLYVLKKSKKFAHYSRLLVFEMLRKCTPDAIPRVKVVIKNYMF